MLAIMSTIIVLSVIFWIICQTISALVGVVFTLALMLLVVKLWKEIFKE